ncbi:MAG: hypothetical protein NVSMB32_11430 [Actinomycetota bacterium]
MYQAMAAAANQVVATKETWPSTYWLVPAIPLTFYMGVALVLHSMGKSDKRNPLKYFFGCIAESMERLTGVAGWAMAGALTGLLFLLVAAIGLYWDVSWHVDFGRDVGTLFTPPHVTILFGLGGLIFASLISISFATTEEADTKLRFGKVRVPYGGLLLGIMGIGAIAAFPLDNLWHWAYGLDVTLWSPTHLQLVTGGSLGAFAVMLLFAEAMPFSKPNAHGRFWLCVAGGAVLTAVSTFQGEFDFKVPQFQPVYLPILIMAGAGIALTFTRIAIGRWGAIKTVIAYLVIRTFLSGLVASLHHEFAHFPLYLPSALAVEAAAYLVSTRNRTKFGLVAGALIGTVGLAGETIWIAASGWFAPAPTLLVRTLELAPITAVAAALLGAGLGRAFKRGDKPIPVGALAVAGIVVLTALYIPLARNVGNVHANVTLNKSADGQTATVTVALNPANAAKNAEFFGVAAWQGGGTKQIVLKETATPGTYTESAPVPIAGKWKSMVTLVKGSENMAVGIYLPPDVLIKAPEIPAIDRTDVAFVKNTTLLLRETHSGPAWPSQMGWTGLGLSAAIFIGLIAFSATNIETVEGDEDEQSRSSGLGQLWSPNPRVASPLASSWRPPQPASVPAARWQPGGLTGANRR